MAQNTRTPDILHPAPGSWAWAKKLFAGLAIAGAVLSIIGFFVDKDQFFHSYLTAYIFLITVVLGALFFVMVQHLARAGWSVAVRRFAEVVGWTVPFLAVLFLPVLAGLHELYHWTHHEAVEHDPLLQHKSGYLNVPFFIVRAVVYAAVWSLLGRYFLRRSVEQDASKDPKLTTEMQRRAAPGMLLFAVTLSFMSFDWLMSMDPHWYSTIFGVYIFAGSALACFAFLTLTGIFLRRGEYLSRTISVDHFQDLGRLMFAFSVFWAYIAFSQYFLIWYGNIPEETIWYVHRMTGSWKPLSIFLAAGHFAVPFVLLMSRWTKRRPGLVGGLAVWILIMHYLDMYWIVMPNLHHEGVQGHWMDLACLALMTGVFMTLFLRKLNGQALVPAGDPRLPESLGLEHLY